MNSRPSTPLCQSCLMTELYCQCVREMDREPCCHQCDHRGLPPDIRSETGIEVVSDASLGSA